MKVIIVLITMIFLVGDLQSAENRTVVEGRVWDYYEAGLNYGEPYAYISKGYHFEGTQEFNEITYNVFRDSASSPVAYMREEDNRVFLYVDEEHLSSSISSDFEIGNEVLLYDFNLKKRDVSFYTSFPDPSHRWGDVVEIEILATGELKYEENLFPYQEFVVTKYPDIENPNKNIEGLGNVCGLLPFPQFTKITAGFNSRWETLLRVSDSEGNVIYENEELLTAISGVERVCDDVPDQTLYDLHGRRVSNPLPGSVYIKGGRKYVGR